MMMKNKEQLMISQCLSNFILILLIFLHLNIVYAEQKITFKNLLQIKKNVNLISRSNLLMEIQEFLYHSTPSRVVGSKGHFKARKFLLKKLLSYTQKKDGENLVSQEFTPKLEEAIRMYRDDFQREIIGKFHKKDSKYKKWDLITKETVKFIKSKKNINGINYIWSKKGYINSQKYFYIGAHYDNLAHNLKTWVPETNVEVPGADNNATGVILALNLIKILSKIDLPYTVVVIFYDFSELGFLGSKHFVRSLKVDKKNILGVINLEMLGHDSKRYDLEKKTGNMRIYLSKENSSTHAKELRFAKQFQRRGRQINSAVNFKIISNGFNSSDHLMFWEAGIPAMTFTQSWDTDFNPLYHSSKDIPETLNMRTYYYSVKYIIGATIATLFDISN